MKSIGTATTGFLWENTSGASEDAEDEAAEEGKAQQAVVNGVVVVVVRLGQFTYLGEPVGNGCDSADVHEATDNLGCKCI